MGLLSGTQYEAISNRKLDDKRQPRVQRTAYNQDITLPEAFTDTTRKNLETFSKVFPANVHRSFRERRKSGLASGLLYYNTDISNYNMDAYALSHNLGPSYYVIADENNVAKYVTPAVDREQNKLFTPKVAEGQHIADAPITRLARENAYKDLKTPGQNSAHEPGGYYEYKSPDAFQWQAFVNREPYTVPEQYKYDKSAYKNFQTSKEIEWYQNQYKKGLISTPVYDRWLNQRGYGLNKLHYNPDFSGYYGNSQGTLRTMYGKGLIPKKHYVSPNNGGDSMGDEGAY